MRLAQAFTILRDAGYRPHMARDGRIESECPACFGTAAAEERPLRLETLDGEIAGLCLSQTCRVTAGASTVAETTDRVVAVLEEVGR